MKNKLVLTLTLALMLCACKTHKNTVATPQAATNGTAAEVSRYNARIKTFSGRASLSLNSATMGSKVVVKSIVDSALTISLQPFMGIEMGRIYCDKREIILIDKYHNQCASYLYASNPTLPLSLDAIQSLLLGRYFDPFGVGFNNYLSETDSQNRQLSYTHNDIKAEFLSNPLGQLVRSYFHTTDYKTYGMAEYSDFDATHKFPQKMGIKLASPKMIESMTLEYNKFEINSSVTVERPSTDKYKQVKVEKFLEEVTKF